jgi:hypothetical protein
MLLPFTSCSFLRHCPHKKQALALTPPATIQGAQGLAIARAGGRDYRGLNMLFLGTGPMELGKLMPNSTGL